MMQRLLGGSALILIGLGSPETSPTQEPARLQGAVASEDGRAVGQAEVFLTSDSASYTTTTRPDGGFLFAAVTPGEYFLFVRRLGYEAQNRLVRLAPGESHPIHVRMPVMPLWLNPIEVKARSGFERTITGPIGAYRTAWGKRLTAELIAERGVGGLPRLVNQYLPTQGLSQFDHLQVEAGFDPFGRPPSTRVRPGPIRGCPPMVSINGATAVNTIFIGDLPPWLIQEIDIYPPQGFGQLRNPPSAGPLGSDTSNCGLIVVWTK